MVLNKLSQRLIVVAGLALGIVSVSAHAKWTLNTQNPVFTFVTTKAVNNSEVQMFKKLHGGVSSSGKIDVHVDLTSVDTRIAIRDKRMREMLFEIGQYPTTAHFSGQLPAALLQKIKAGKVAKGMIEGQLTMHGQTKPKKLAIQVFPEGKNLWVVTTSPVLISAKNFGMQGGLEALREIMGLPSINDKVAAEFVLEFSPN